MSRRRRRHSFLAGFVRTSTGRCDVEGIHRFVAEQFDVASQIITGGLCPISEIEVVHSPYKSATGDMLGAAITLDRLDSQQFVMLKSSRKPNQKPERRRITGNATPFDRGHLQSVCQLR